MDLQPPIYVLNKTLSLYQAPEGFRTSMDSVLLGAACPAKAGESVLDMGCGVGSAGLCVLKRVEGSVLTGFDIQACHVDIAQRNAQENDMEDRTTFLQADVRDYLDIGSFDHVICNPPYMPYGSYIRSPSAEKARATGCLENDLEMRVWTTRAWNHIKKQGSLSIIHDAGQTDTLIQALYGAQGGRRFGRVEILPIYSKTGVAAKRVIVRAWKHKQSPATLYAGLVIHDAQGGYTKEADNVLRHTASLF